MSRKVLNPDATQAEAGFFGKLPCTGDFLARGLPSGFCVPWDAWVTRHLAGRLREAAPWPDGGLRFRLASGGRVAAGVIVPGADAAGRAFPLSLIVIADRLPAPAKLETWCDAALTAAEPARRGIEDGDMLLTGLDEVTPPDGVPADESRMELWVKGSPPCLCDPGDPTAAIASLFGL